MDSLRDPAALHSRANVAYREEDTENEPDAFEYFEGIDGLAVVGVTNDDGAVLLMDSPHGWRLPYGPVGAEADWVAASERIGEELTGAATTITGVERVNHVARTHAEDGRTTTSFDVVLRAAPVAGTPVSADPGFGPWEDLNVQWFDDVPEDAYREHGDVVDDIRLFLE